MICKLCEQPTHSNKDFLCAQCAVKQEQLEREKSARRYYDQIYPPNRYHGD